MNTACVLLLATYAAHAGPTTAGEAAAPVADVNRVGDYRAAVEEREADYGAYSPELSEVLYGLGLALQKEDEHSEAVDHFQHSLHINRVNNGIYHISQEPSLRAIIASYQAMGKNLEVVDLYDQLMLVYSESYGESAPELLPLLEEAANWHRQIYLNNRSKEAVGHLIWSASLTSTAFNIANREPNQFHQQIISLLKGSVYSNWYLTQHFARYRTFMPSRDASFNPRVRTRLMRQVATGAFNAHENASHYGFINGRAAYQQIITILDDNNAPPQQRAQALVELGDWFSIFKRHNSAQETYRRAWDLLAETGDRETLRRLLGKPGLLPSFSSATRAHGSLVKITMDINARGRPHNVEVLNVQPESDTGAADKAKKTIHKSLFRPRYEDGKPVAYKGYTLNFRLID